MSINPDFLELMNSTMTVKPLAGVNDYGEPTFSTSATTHRCRVIKKPQMVRNQMGEEVVAQYSVYAASTYEIPLTSEFTLPDGSTPEVISSSVYVNEEGIQILRFGGV